MTRPDLLDPFTARIAVAGSDLADPALLVSSLLEDIARRCEAAGSSLIGHVKCHVVAGDARFHCHLTSLRSGARCEQDSRPVTGASPVPGALQIDLAVLVYGLNRETIGAMVSEALAAALRGGATWSVSA